MKLVPKATLLGLVTLGLTLTSMHAAPLRVLYFTKSAGYEHSVVKRENGQPSYSERIFTKLGAAHNIEFTFSKDGGKFSPEYFQQFDAIVFYTSGDLSSVGNDGQPAITPAGKQALLEAIAGGKGFVGLHSAADTYHTGETGGGNPSDRANRYKLHGDASDDYIKMLGGEFINHNAQQVAKATVIDKLFPGCRHLGDAFNIKEEWYSMKEFAPDLHVLLRMETKGMEGVDYQRPPYPLAWARKYGKGRVWCNGMGHREDVWDSPKFQQMVIGGIEWAAGRIKAEVPPNLEAVTPGASTLPPFRPGT